MNTKVRLKSKQKQEKMPEPELFIVDMPSRPQAGQGLSDLMQVMRSVDVNAPDAKKNETSISDNNGGRIELDEDLKNPKVIKK